MAAAIGSAKTHINGGNRTANATMVRAPKSPKEMSGEERSTTGSNVHPDTLQIELSSTPMSGAIRAGASSGNQNATAAKRRGGVSETSMSEIAACDGLLSQRTTSSGIAT